MGYLSELFDCKQLQTTTKRKTDEMMTIMKSKYMHRTMMHVCIDVTHNHKYYYFIYISLFSLKFHFSFPFILHN